MTRSRKFNPQSLFLLVLHLAAGTNREGYFSALQKTWIKSGLKLKDIPAKSSLSEFRDKVSSLFFKDIFEQDLKRIHLDRKKFRGLFVYAVDGDHLDLPASKEILTAGYRGYPHALQKETYYPKMYTAQAYDVINGLVKKFSYSSTISEAHLARQMVKDLEKDSVVIYDRLHSSYQTVFTHIKAGNYFLMRVRSQNPKNQFEIASFCKGSERSAWIGLNPGRQERKTYPTIKVRLVKVKNPRSKEDLVFMTNLSEQLFSDEEIGSLYQRRWEIEGNFRDLTNTLKMCQWHTTKINGILQEIYALLWLVNAVKLQCSQITKTTTQWLDQKYKKSNFKFCVQLVIENLDLLIKQKWKKFNEVLRYWITRTVEKRVHLSRSYPRQLKLRGKTYTNASVVGRRLVA